MSYALQLPTKYARGVQIPGNQGYVVDVEPGWENERRIYYVKYTVSGAPFLTQTTSNVTLYHPDIHLGVSRYVMDLDRVDSTAYLAPGAYLNAAYTVTGTAIKQWIDATYVHASTTSALFVSPGLMDAYVVGTPFITNGISYGQFNGSYSIDAVAPTGVAIAPTATTAAYVFTGANLTIPFATAAPSPPYIVGQSIVLSGFTATTAMNAQWQVLSCTTTQVVLNCTLSNTTTVSVVGTMTSYGYIRYKHPFGYTPSTASITVALTWQYNSFEWERLNSMYFYTELNTRITLGETRLCTDGGSTGIGSYKDVRLTKIAGYTFGDLGNTYYTGTTADPAIFNDSFGYGNNDANKYKRVMTYSNPWCTLTSSTQAMVIPNDTMTFSFSITDAPLATTKYNKPMLNPSGVLVDKTYYFTIRPNPVF